MLVSIPISIGELFDRYSIIGIKQEKIKDNVKLKSLLVEHNLLKEKMGMVVVGSEFENLRIINLQLWNVEEEIRIKEKDGCFGQRFIWLARQVYTLNGERSRIKSIINKKFNSEIKEIKSYEK